MSGNRWGCVNTGNILPSFPQLTVCYPKCERTEMSVGSEFLNILLIKIYIRKYINTIY